MRGLLGWAVVGAAVAAGLGGDDPGAKPSASAARREAQAALKEYGPLVGPWKGTGMPRRGQNKGAWTESAAWSWRLTPDAAALALDIEKGKYLKGAVLRPGRELGSFSLDATLTDGSKRAFSGRHEAGKPLVLAAEGAGDGLRRITLTIPNENRFLLLLEGADGPSSPSYARLGEVGFTRQGVAFAAGESGPECIVTGGRGTMKVSHAGKEYWVCCSGCRDLFNAEPAEVLAEAAAKARAGGK